MNIVILTIYDNVSINKNLRIVEIPITFKKEDGFLRQEQQLKSKGYYSWFEISLAYN